MLGKKKSNNNVVLPNSEPPKSKVLAFHLYTKHYEEFLETCERLGVFHSEVLRKLVLNWLKKNRKDESIPPLKSEKSIQVTY